MIRTGRKRVVSKAVKFHIVRDEATERQAIISPRTMLSASRFPVDVLKNIPKYLIHMANIHTHISQCGLFVSCGKPPTY